MVDLTDAQVDFSGSLKRASATDVTSTLYSRDDRWAQNKVERQVTVGVEFAGTGQITGDAAHGDLCWSMGATCRSVTVDSSRSATGTLTMDGETATGAGSLSHARSLVVGAPR